MSEGPITKASDHANRACPDCGQEMFRIKIIDATGSGVSGEGISHVELCYAAEDADASCVVCSEAVRLGRASGVTPSELGADAARGRQGARPK